MYPSIYKLSNQIKSARNKIVARLLESQLFRRNTPKKGVTFAKEERANIVDLKQRHWRFFIPGIILQFYRKRVREKTAFPRF